MMAQPQVPVLTVFEGDWAVVEWRNQERRNQDTMVVDGDQGLVLKG